MALLAPELLHGFYSYQIFINLFVIGHRPLRKQRLEAVDWTEHGGQISDSRRWNLDHRGQTGHCGK